MSYTDNILYKNEVKTRLPQTWRDILDRVAEKENVSLSCLVRMSLYEQILKEYFPEDDIMTDMTNTVPRGQTGD
jgi:hypothetical protein